MNETISIKAIRKVVPKVKIIAKNEREFMSSQ